MPGRRRSVSVGVAGVAAGAGVRPEHAGSSAPRAAGAGGLNARGGLGRLARSLLGFLPRRVQDRLAGFLFRGLARLFFAPARLLGGREDGDRLLLAPLGLALRRLALLLDQRALPRGLLGGRQGATGQR